LRTQTKIELIPNKMEAPSPSSSSVIIITRRRRQTFSYFPMHPRAWPPPRAQERRKFISLSLSLSLSLLLLFSFPIIKQSFLVFHQERDSLNLMLAYLNACAQSNFGEFRFVDPKEELHFVSTLETGQSSKILEGGAAAADSPGKSLHTRNYLLPGK
jgi:hypothetical protein